MHRYEGCSKSSWKNAAMSLICKLAELNLYSNIDKHNLYIYSKFCWSGMNTILTVVAMETIHHDYRPTFYHLYKKSMFNNVQLIFTLLFSPNCMSKVQYNGGKHITSCKCMTSFRRKTAILCMPKMRGKQRSSINYVFGTDIKRKKHC